MSAAALAVALALAAGHAADAGNLPDCANRTINEVVKRSGCTVGDTRCWVRSGGFCTDWVARSVAPAAGRGAAARLEPISPEQVRRGDVAVFAARAHAAVVERVVNDGAGRPVAVDVSEYNFGGCWVDRGAMVTEKYGVVTRRRAVPLRDVDGGFMRAPTAAR